MLLVFIKITTEKKRLITTAKNTATNINIFVWLYVCALGCFIFCCVVYDIILELVNEAAKFEPHLWLVAGRFDMVGHE